MLRLAAVAAVFSAFAVNVAGGAPAAVVPATVAAVPGAPSSELSVMTYNVKGLPWPIALGRSSALLEIGRRLRHLRTQGRQPHVVLLQEAFIPEAKALGAIGGYPYVVSGPQPQDSSAAPTGSLDGEFRAKVHWSKGEGEGKWVDSGLLILSDYPVVATAKMAFPQDACAGFDCLATKGAVLAQIKVPGVDKPVTVVDTHLNARHASGVSTRRANEAYAWQVVAVRQFVERQVAPGSDVIFGGDFNLGHDRDRLAAAAKDGGLLPGGQEVIATMDGRVSAPSGSDFDFVVSRAKDKEYFRAGQGSRLQLTGVDVPFGASDGGFGLSDHLGFVADYRLQ
ncbi:endonuclease (plasmid) [Novosphingobium pentaromativorans US6-1]|uniref:Endonuclease/exonuclease/phosphatase n=2 Tax=Novosphingobium pentaromativorans TaxID=205844 RepID=G6EH57_9SPHN|nr:endonuclease [Novosphingobium pentaromativorans US6-1]EHJ59346.1 endonuclease/exonuclease/phosphatase [Novosphingobium pentaromativorans US6-1]